MDIFTLLDKVRKFSHEGLILYDFSDVFISYLKHFYAEKFPLRAGLAGLSF